MDFKENSYGRWISVCIMDYRPNYLIILTEFDFFWTLDARKNISKRMFQYQTQQPEVSELNLRLRKQEIFCYDFIVYILVSVAIGNHIACLVNIWLKSSVSYRWFILYYFYIIT